MDKIRITGNLFADDLIDNHGFIELWGGKTETFTIEIEGNVRVRGTFRPWCPVEVEGDVFVGGGTV